jgi:hypothetical protein
MNNSEYLIERINNYLSTGGLFNPEMADHNKVRDLLIECRAEMANSQVEFVSAENDGRDVRRVG